MPLAPAPLELAPDPKLAPAAPPAAAPVRDASIEPGPALPDIPLAARPPAALLPLLDVRLSLHDQLIANDGFDPFSEDDQLPTFRVATSVRALQLEGGGAISAVASLDLSGTSSNVRGLPTELDQLRIGLGPELRLPLGEHVYFSGRVSPQAVLVSSQLDQGPSNALEFSQEQWAFGVDASVGAAVRIAQLRPAALERPLGVFLYVEGGYVWTSSVELELQAGSSAPVRSEPLRLGELSLHGLSLGGGIGVGY